MNRLYWAVFAFSGRLKFWVGGFSGRFQVSVGVCRLKVFGKGYRGVVSR